MAIVIQKMFEWPTVSTESMHVFALSMVITGRENIAA